MTGPNVGQDPNWDQDELPCFYAPYYSKMEFLFGQFMDFSNDYGIGENLYLLYMYLFIMLDPPRPIAYEVEPENNPDAPAAPE